jgi:hypothetical protein
MLDNIYIQSIIIIILTIVLISIKCKYEFTTIDKFIFMSNDNFILYIFSHTIIYLFLGLLTGFSGLLLTIIRTLLVEISLLYIRKCRDYTYLYQDIMDINLKTALISTLISIISYICGSILKEVYNQGNGVYIYIIGSIVSTIIFLVLKCEYNIKIFDKYLYSEKPSIKGDDIDAILKFILFRIVYYIILGSIFQFNGWFWSILQTILLEFMILYGENCDMNININSGIYSIIIGLTSYFVGAFISKKIFG